MQARNLQDSRYQLLLDSQDLDSLCDYFPVLPGRDVTGAIVCVSDGDYQEVYVTEDSRPYELDTEYHTIDYFAKEVVLSSDGYADGGEPYTDEELEIINK